MTDPRVDVLLALAARLEASNEYDGRLMAEIDCAVRFRDLRPAEPDDHPNVKDRRFDPSSIWTRTGWLMSCNYFRSIDDAMKLVPAGWYGRVEPRFYDDEGDVRWRGYAIRPDWGRWTPYEDWCATEGPTSAKMPALALSAAALRAHAHTLRDQPLA